MILQLFSIEKATLYVHKVNAFIDEKETIMHGKVRVSLHACTNNYLRCKKCEVHDLVCKHVIGCTEKYVPRFLTLEALVIWENVNIFLLDVKSITQHDGGAGCILSEKNLSQNKG